MVQRKDPYNPEVRISLELLKRALDGGHIASASIDEVYGPLVSKLESNESVPLKEVHEMLENWLDTWQEVRRICDAYMKRNRTYFEVRPHANLSPILLQFEDNLIDILEDEEIDAQTALHRTREACDELRKELDVFYGWAEEVGRPIGIDFEDAKEKSHKRAERFWLPNVRALEKMMAEA